MITGGAPRSAAFLDPLLPRGLFLRLRLRRAAKRYARRLPPQLHRSYGASETYTAAQIRTAAAKQRLDGDFLVLGYAAFLDEDLFCCIVRKLSVRLSYRQARELFMQFLPTDLRSAFGSPGPPPPGFVS